MSDIEENQDRSPSWKESPGKAASPARSNSSKRSRSPAQRYNHRSRSKSNGRDSRSNSRQKTKPQRRRSYDSRSRSRSYDRRRSERDGRDYGRNRSPRRNRYDNDRDKPKEGRCLGVFGMSHRTLERDLIEIFEQYGPVDKVQIIYDRLRNESRGFGFVYMKYTEDAKDAKDRVNGMDVHGRNIRVDFSITESAHEKTPGRYMGRSSDYGGDSRDSRSRRSPVYDRREARYSRSRSRSRSYSRRY